jgi:hypothetical protein
MSSCTEEFVPDTGTTYTRLCVEGYITTDTTAHKVRLTKTRNLGDSNPFEGIANADITISDGFNTFPLTEDSVEKGSYFTDPTVYGIPGRTYTLNIDGVDVDGDGIMETYSAQSELHSINPVDSFAIFYNNFDAHMKGWSLNLYAKDKGGRNFYLIKAKKNGVMLTDSIYKYSFSDNLGFEGKYYNGFQAYFIEETDSTKVLQGDTITLEMCGITQAYFTFIYESVMDYYPKVPIFSGPSANVSTNLPKDKAVGFFAAYSIARKSKIYK